MARALQQGQARRIGAQLNPDGTPFQPRKPQLRPQNGTLRRKAMFTALRRAKFLRTDADDKSFWVGFTGRASRIASIHQYGLRDRPSLRAKPVTYPARELLGDTPADRENLLDILFDHLAAA
jgi:phage virion morphogenesis protein